MLRISYTKNPKNSSISDELKVSTHVSISTQTDFER